MIHIWRSKKTLLLGLRMTFCFNLSKHILWLRTYCPDVYSVQICQTGIFVSFKLNESKKQPYFKNWILFEIHWWYFIIFQDLKILKTNIRSDNYSSRKPELIYKDVTHIFVLFSKTSFFAENRSIITEPYKFLEFVILFVGANGLR